MSIKIFSEWKTKNAVQSAQMYSGWRRSSPRPAAATTSSSAATPSSSSTTTCHCKTERETNYTSVSMAELQCHIHEFRWFFPNTHQPLSSLTWLWARCRPAACPEEDCRAGWSSGCCCHGYWETPAEWALCFWGSSSQLWGECSYWHPHLCTRFKEKTYRHLSIQELLLNVNLKQIRWTPL